MRSYGARRGLALTVLLAAGALLTGCAAALRPLDTSSELGRRDPALIDRAAAAQWGAEAEALYADRPDPEKVERAQELWMQAAAADPDSVAGILGAVRAMVWRTNHLEGKEARQQVARSAVETAQWCSRRDPGNARCHYWLALALGVQADARRATATDGLRHMVQQLQRAIEIAPEIDNAGPDRIMARVLVNAPGWPTGPGDPDQGLEHAKRAVERFPEFPPNLLALAEAYCEIDRRAASREQYRRALDLALTAQQQGHPDAPEWIQEAREALADLE